MADQVHTSTYLNIVTNPGKKGLVLSFNKKTDEFIIFPGLHKTHAVAPLFAMVAKNYL